MFREPAPMLSPEELIDNLERKGVKFEYDSKEKAKEYLADNNAYYKLTAYRKNFRKYEVGPNRGKYIDVDYKQLSDLAILDMILRKNVLNIALDLEHYAKMKLLEHIQKIYKRDGYAIVDEYIRSLPPRDKETLDREIDKNTNSPYCKSLVDKYGNSYPVWAFVEIITFGSFAKFYMFVGKKLGNKELSDDAWMLSDVRELRNACAHNNCILNNLIESESTNPNFKLNRAISDAGISSAVRDKRLSNRRIMQIATLLYLNKEIVSSRGVWLNQAEDLQEMLDRIKYSLEYKKYYENNEQIKANLEFIIKLIDTWYPDNVEYIVDGKRKKCKRKVDTQNSKITYSFVEPGT